jgi:hypothetical protein
VRIRRRIRPKIWAARLRKRAAAARHLLFEGVLDLLAGVFRVGLRLVPLPSFSVLLSPVTLPTAHQLERDLILSKTVVSIPVRRSSFTIRRELQLDTGHHALSQSTVCGYDCSV